MFPFIVVAVKPVRHIVEKFYSGFVRLQVNPLIFQGSPESLDIDVVSETPFAVHADFNVPGLEY